MLAGVGMGVVWMGLCEGSITRGVFQAFREWGVKTNKFESSLKESTKQTANRAICTVPQKLLCGWGGGGVGGV